MERKEADPPYLKNKMKSRIITWRDSNMFITQCDKDEEFEVAVISSVGFVIREDKTKIVLAGDLVDDEFRRVIVIPKENIISSLSKTNHCQLKKRYMIIKGMHYSENCECEGCKRVSGKPKKIGGTSKIAQTLAEERERVKGEIEKQHVFTGRDETDDDVISKDKLLASLDTNKE